MSEVKESSSPPPEEEAKSKAATDPVEEKDQAKDCSDDDADRTPPEPSEGKPPTKETSSSPAPQAKDDTTGGSSPPPPHEEPDDDAAALKDDGDVKEEDDEPVREGGLLKSSYRDFSHILPQPSTESTGRGRSTVGKDPTFPVKLHMILSTPEFNNVICWLPHGRSWRILQQKAFEEHIIPLFFRHGRYSSFARQVNGWGFRRLTHGRDFNSYYHEMFLRGMPHLCEKMKRLTKKDATHKHKLDEEDIPDFYELSRRFPLPESTRHPAITAQTLAAARGGFPGGYNLEASLRERANAEMMQRLNMLGAQGAPFQQQRAAQALRDSGILGGGAGGFPPQQGGMLPPLGAAGLPQRDPRGALPPGVLSSLAAGGGVGGMGAPGNEAFGNPNDAATLQQLLMDASATDPNVADMVARARYNNMQNSFGRPSL